MTASNWNGRNARENKSFGENDNRQLFRRGNFQKELKFMIELKIWSIRHNRTFSNTQSWVFLEVDKNTRVFC